MRAISLWQPWASAIALGHKTIETRGWSTSYRGLLVIHAAKVFGREARDFAAVERALGRMPERVPLGALVAVSELIDVQPTEELDLSISAIERLYGDYTPGRFGWKLANIRALPEPIVWRGAQGFFSVPDHIIEKALEAAPA